MCVDVVMYWMTLVNALIRISIIKYKLVATPKNENINSDTTCTFV